VDFLTPLTGPLTTYLGGNRLHTIFLLSIAALVLAVATHLTFGAVAGAADSQSNSNTLVSLLLVVVSGLLIQFERARNEGSSGGRGQLQQQQVNESHPLITKYREEPSLNSEHEEGKEEEEAPTDEFPTCSQVLAVIFAGSLVVESVVNFFNVYGFPVFVPAFQSRVEGQAFAFFFFAVNLLVSFGVLWKVMKRSRDYG